jgi:hypothetical protein
MKAGSHPIELLDLYAEKLGRAFELEFSKYVYLPRSSEDNREYFQVSSKEARALYADLLGSLKPNQDLALHSKFKLSDGSRHHIPMLDLQGEFREAWVEPIHKLLSGFGVDAFAVYATGRSAHVYGLGPIAEENLVPFFARALLLNLPDEEPIVDVRWIGHRLEAGYGSLRWSCNGPQYLQRPELVGEY